MKREDGPQVPTSDLIAQVELISTSYFRLFGAPLLPAGLFGDALFRAAWDAPFVLVSHDTQAEPKFNFGNREALLLWEMELGEFLGLESRYSAEEEHREERARMLKQVAKTGFFSDYHGVRASKNGRRFRIERALVFNLTSPSGAALGQAAIFRDWTSL